MGVGLDLTVLGCAGSHTGQGRMCSGYLVEAAGQRLLIDAGNGSTGNLQRSVAVRDLDAVVISHGHVDHCIDLIGCYYNLRFDPGFTGRMPLYAADGVHELLTSLLSGDSPMTFDDVYEHHEVAHGDHIEVGGISIRFARSWHPVPTVSMRIEVDGATLAYSGDSAGGEELIGIARGADLFLCEATWAGDAGEYPPGIHLTARDAAALANEAGVARLVLTHLAGATDRQQVLAEATAVFDGPVELAEDLAHYHLDAQG